MIKIEMNANNETVEILPSKIKIPSSGLSENLQHVEQNCQFTVPYDAGLLSFLLRNNVINAVVKDDSNALFTGQITVDTSWTDNGEEGLIESFDLSISDNTRLFDKKTENEVALIHTNLSAVIQKICLDCGVEIESVANLPTTELPAFVLDAGKSYLESLNTLLYEYGYAFGFNENGELKIFDIATEPTQLSLIGENELFAGVSLQKVKKTYDSVKITYANLIKRTDEQVYFEGNDLNSDNEIVPITIRPNQYYPYESDPAQEAREGQVFQTFEAGYAESYTLYSGEKKYRRTNKTQLVYTENHRIVEDWEGNLTINRTAFGARQASVRFFNQTSSDVNLYQLAIRADAYYRSENIFLALGSGSSPYESETEYIFAQSTAERFASMLSRFVMGGNLKISANLENQVYPGRAYVIDTGATALSTTAICISCNYDPENEKYEASFLTYGEASIDIHRRRERGICQKTYSYEQLKGEKGDQGEPGTAAKFVEIEADSGLVFKNGSPSQLPLKCIATGFTASAYQWYKDGTTIPGATSQTYNATDAGVYKVTANGYSDIATVISVSDGADGNDGTSPYACSVSNENFTVATGTDLKPLSVTTYSVKFTAYKGSSQLSAIAPSATIASGKFKVSTPTVTGFEVAQSTNGTITFKTATSTAISENLSVNVTVTYDNGSSETKTITISASKTGAKGASSYSYVRYSAKADGTDFTATPSSATKYVGFYSGTSSTAPTDKASYTWTKFVGEDGANGTSLTSKGNWASGTAYKVMEVVYYTTNKTSYVCKKAHTSSSSILPTNTTYWTVLAAPGTDGSDGADGQDATQYYMHFVYCDNTTSGTNYSTTESRKYIGIYTDTTQADAATFPEANAKSGIVWSKAEGNDITISSTEVKYQASTSNTTVPTGTWNNAIPSVSAGSYLWTRTIVNYSDGNSTTAYSVARQGQNSTVAGPRAIRYLGKSSTVGSGVTNKNPTDLGTTINGDWFLNTNDGYVYYKTGDTAWSKLTCTSGTPDYRIVAAIEDLIVLSTTITTNTTLNYVVDKYVECIIAGTAFINKLFAKNLSFLKNDAVVWKLNTTYRINDIVLFRGQVYKCKTAHSSGTGTIDPTNTSYWTKISDDYSEYLTGIKSEDFVKSRLVDKLDVGTKTFGFNMEFNPAYTEDVYEFSPSLWYEFGDVVKYNNKYYKCIKNDTSGSCPIPTNTTYWTEITINQLYFSILWTHFIHTYGLYANDIQTNEVEIRERVSRWATSTTYYVNSIVAYNGRYYRCKTQHTSSSSILPTNTSYWDSTATNRPANCHLYSDGINFRVTDNGNGYQTNGALYLGLDTTELSVSSYASPKALMKVPDFLYLYSKSSGSVGKVLTSNDIWVE